VVADWKRAPDYFGACAALLPERLGRYHIRPHRLHPGRVGRLQGGQLLDGLQIFAIKGNPGGFEVVIELFDFG